jgi:5-methylcytosine-specific restriction endonuclease McrA
MEKQISYRKFVKSRDVCCRLCSSDQDLQIHHLIWKCYGGTNDCNNLILLCHKCHRIQHNGKGINGELVKPSNWSETESNVQENME